MAQMPIEILDVRKRRTEILPLALRRANDAQEAYNFSVLESPKSAELLFAVHHDTDIDRFMPRVIERKLIWRGYHPFLICLFDTAINSRSVGNLFSVDLACDGFAAVTTHNVTDVLIPNDRIRSYLIFHMALFALKFSGGDIPFHEEDRGCIFDYRQDKTGIVHAIRNAAICDHCKELLSNSNGTLSSGQITGILALLEIASQELQYSSTTTSQRKQRIFIGSSTEGLSVSRAIQSELEHDYDVEVWNQSDVFGLGTSTLEALEAAVSKYDFGVFVFTPDDKISMRGEDSPVARDNVMFEAGLFIGKLGRYRSFIVRPRGLQMQVPSDLNGITVADYDPTKSSIGAAVGAACSKLRTAISKVQP